MFLEGTWETVTEKNDTLLMLIQLTWVYGNTKTFHSLFIFCFVLLIQIFSQHKLFKLVIHYLSLCDNFWSSYNTVPFIQIKSKNYVLDYTPLHSCYLSGWSDRVTLNERSSTSSALLVPSSLKLSRSPTEALLIWGWVISGCSCVKAHFLTEHGWCCQPQ